MRRLLLKGCLRQQLRGRLNVAPRNVTLSVGAVSLRGEFGSFGEVMAEVDRLIYEAKDRGSGASGIQTEEPSER